MNADGEMIDVEGLEAAASFAGLRNALVYSF